jgi:NAD(P)-dependent dehydrogenase (short-subunit alcohol dehydrogenase family)
MRARPRGDIVFISSAAVVLMAPRSAPYNMAKAALEALAWTLAKEERRHGVHVNVVAPGLVDTEMGRRLVKGAMGVDDIRTMDGSSPFGHVCSPDEVADAVRFLVGPQGGYLTAQRLGVDGGPF